MACPAVIMKTSATFSFTIRLFHTMLRARTRGLPKAVAANKLKGAARVTAEYGTAHHADFLKKFNQQAAQKRALSTKAQFFSAERHAALRQQIGKMNFITSDYVDTTKINISKILSKWQLYYCFVNEIFDECKSAV